MSRVAPIDSGAVLSDLGSASRTTVFTIVQFSLDVGGMPGWIWGVSCPVGCWRNRQDRSLLGGFVPFSASRRSVLSSSRTRTRVCRPNRVARDLRISEFSLSPDHLNVRPRGNGHARPGLVG